MGPAGPASRSQGRTPISSMVPNRPTFGRLMPAGLTGRGFGGLGLRTLALRGGAIGAVAICGWDCYGGSDATVAGVVSLAGLAIGTGLAIHDLATLKGAVARRRALPVSLIPTFRPRDHALGISVYIAF